jgi:hypothetical protein
MGKIIDIRSAGDRSKSLFCWTLYCLLSVTGESSAQFAVQVRAPGIIAQLDHDKFWEKITIISQGKASAGGGPLAPVQVALEKDWTARFQLKQADVQKISWQLNEGNEWILYPPYDTAENRQNPVKTFYVTSYDKIRIDTIKALQSQIKASGKFKEADDELAKVEEVYQLAPTEHIAAGVDIPIVLPGDVSVPDQLHQMLKDLIEATESYRVQRDERVGVKTAARDYEETWRLKLISKTEVAAVLAAKALDAATNEAEKTSRRLRLDVALRRLLVAVHDWDFFAASSYLRPPKKRVADQKKADEAENQPVAGNPRQPVKDKVGLDGAYYNKDCKTGFRGDLKTVLWALQKSEVRNAIENKFQAIANGSDASAVKAKDTMILWNRIIDTDLDNEEALDDLALPDIESLLDGLFEPYRGH